MKFLTFSLPALAFAVLSVNATGPCNLSTVEKPTIEPVVQDALDKLAASPVFSALKKRKTDVFGNEIVFSCTTGYTCISLKEKLMCVSLKIDGLSDGSFKMESGTFGTLKNGNYELKQDAGMFGGRTTGNFLSGPYNTKTSAGASPTAQAGAATTTEECGAAFLIGTKTAAGCISETPTTLAKSTTSEECGAAFLIGSKTAAGCISETSKAVAAATSKGSAGEGARVGYMLMAGAAGAGLFAI